MARTKIINGHLAKEEHPSRILEERLLDRDDLIEEVSKVEKGIEEIKSEHLIPLDNSVDALGNSVKAIVAALKELSERAISADPDKFDAERFQEQRLTRKLIEALLERESALKDLEAPSVEEAARQKAILDEILSLKTFLKVDEKSIIPLFDPIWWKEHLHELPEEIAKIVGKLAKEEFQPIIREVQTSLKPQERNIHDAPVVKDLFNEIVVASKDLSAKVAEDQSNKMVNQLHVEVGQLLKDSVEAGLGKDRSELEKVRDALLEQKKELDSRKKELELAFKSRKDALQKNRQFDHISNRDRAALAKLSVKERIQREMENDGGVVGKFYRKYTNRQTDSEAELSNKGLIPRVLGSSDAEDWGLLGRVLANRKPKAGSAADKIFGGIGYSGKTKEEVNLERSLAIIKTKLEEVKRKQDEETEAAKQTATGKKPQVVSSTEKPTEPESEEDSKPVVAVVVKDKEKDDDAAPIEKQKIDEPQVVSSTEKPAEQDSEEDDKPVVASSSAIPSAEEIASEIYGGDAFRQILLLLSKSDRNTVQLQDQLKTLTARFDAQARLERIRDQEALNKSSESADELREAEILQREIEGDVDDANQTLGRLVDMLGLARDDLANILGDTKDLKNLTEKLEGKVEEAGEGGGGSSWGIFDRFSKKRGRGGRGGRRAPKPGGARARVPKGSRGAPVRGTTARAPVRGTTARAPVRGTTARAPVMPKASRASPGLGRASTALKGAAIVGTVATVGMGAYDYATAESDSERKDAIAETGGTLAGAAAGAKGGAVAGAAIGVWFGGAGAVPGAIIGGAIGAMGGAVAGSFIGKKIGSWFKDIDDDIPDEVKDAGPDAIIWYLDNTKLPEILSDPDLSSKDQQKLLKEFGEYREKQAQSLDRRNFVHAVSEDYVLKRLREDPNYDYKTFALRFKDVDEPTFNSIKSRLLGLLEKNGEIDSAAVANATQTIPTSDYEQLLRETEGKPDKGTAIVVEPLGNKAQEIPPDDFNTKSTPVLLDNTGLPTADPDDREEFLRDASKDKLQHMSWVSPSGTSVPMGSRNRANPSASLSAPQSTPGSVSRNSAPKGYSDDDIIDRVFKHEGGYNPTDPGPTPGNVTGSMWGVTGKTLAAWRGTQDITAEDVQNLSKDEAREIYRNEYVKPFANIQDPQIKDFLVDTGVNMGPGRAREFYARMQKQGITDPREQMEFLKKERISFYRGLAESNPEKHGRWLKGWEQRANSFNYDDTVNNSFPISEAGSDVQVASTQPIATPNFEQEEETKARQQESQNAQQIAAQTDSIVNRLNTAPRQADTSTAGAPTSSTTGGGISDHFTQDDAVDDMVAMVELLGLGNGASRVG